MSTESRLEDASDDEQNEMSLVELAAVDLKEWWIVVARVTEVCEGVKPGAGRLSCQLSTVTVTSRDRGSEVVEVNKKC